MAITFPRWAAPFSRPFGATPSPVDPPPAPGIEETFWRNLRNPARLRTAEAAFPMIGLASAALGGVGEAAGDVTTDIGAAWDVLGGGEDPVSAAATKPLAAKPKEPKKDPVPPNSEAFPIQQPGPAVHQPVSGDLGYALNLPDPATAPPPAPRGQVKIRLADGREFDYGAGESIPLEEQGNFGKGRIYEDKGTSTYLGDSDAPLPGPHFTELGGTGKPGGYATAVTPESRLQRAREESAIARAEEPFPEIRAIEARGDAAAEASLAVEKERQRHHDATLAQEIARQTAAEQIINAHEAWRAPREARLSQAEAIASQSGNEEQLKQVQIAREAFDRELAARERVKNDALAAKDLLRGTYEAGK